MTTKISSNNKNVRLAQILMYLAAASALFAGMGGIANVTAASDDTVVVELWRVIGFFTFAALFTALAYKPQSSKSLWAVVILNKLALSVAGLMLMSNSSIQGTGDLIIFDGGLTLLLIASSLLAGVWKK
jgi:hypothetical protein